MARKKPLEKVKEAIREQLVDDEEEPNAATEKLLERVDDLLQQADANAEDSSLVVPDLAGLDLGRELDDYDEERPESDPPSDDEGLEAGTITEVGAHTASPFGGMVGHAGEERYGSPRPASMGPYGGPIEQRGHRTGSQEQLGDATDESDRLFANRSADRNVPGQVSGENAEEINEVGET